MFWAIQSFADWFTPPFAWTTLGSTAAPIGDEISGST
jgi:hypothetical protein